MQKKLKYQANDSPTQRNEKHFKLPPNALASEKANFQYNAALWYPHGFPLWIHKCFSKRHQCPSFFQQNSAQWILCVNQYWSYCPIIELKRCSSIYNHTSIPTTGTDTDSAKTQQVSYHKTAKKIKYFTQAVKNKTGTFFWLSQYMLNLHLAWH